MDFTSITKDNVRMYAIKHYCNPSCSSMIEFEEDFERLKYIKTLLNKFINNKDINLRILVNHFISFTNVFARPAAVRILFIVNDEEVWPVVATILSVLGMMPEELRLNEFNIKTSNIMLWDLKERLELL